MVKAILKRRPDRRVFKIISLLLQSGPVGAIALLLLMPAVVDTMGELARACGLYLTFYWLLFVLRAGFIWMDLLYEQSYTIFQTGIATDPEATAATID